MTKKKIQVDKLIPKVRSKYRRFNGRLYHRGVTHYSTKEAIKKSQKSRKNDGNTLAVIDKDKKGYFFWIGNKKDKR